MTTVADRPDDVLALPAGDDDAPARTYRPPVLEWLTTTDHKKIGIMYMVTAFLFFMLGGVEALYIRTELAAPGLQFFDENAYNQLFTIHATIMVFLFVMPMLSGLGNYILPLQIGAPDMAFPRINALSFWMVPLGGIILLSSYFVEGGPAATGWTFYSPLSQAKYNGTGADLWLAAITILGVATTLGGVNFLVTVFKMRAPGMTMLRMPIFCWTVVVTAVLSVLSLPVVASAFIMLFIDRNFGGRFFDPAVGGDPILYQHIFWFFAHPEVYILVLPAMGVVSEIIPVFSRKPLFGYTAFIYATCGIGALGFSVWAHHMFTTGAVAVTFFSGMTALIGIPTGVKFFNWLATLWRGKVLLATPMLFAVGFMFTFLIGGITGVFLSAVTVDYALHDTYFVVGHFHFTVFGGATFGIYGALYYWFPKFSGRKLNERVGKVHFWLHFTGTMLLFSPMLVLGAMGMPRRIADYGADREFQGWNVVATIGAYIVALSVLPFLYNVVITLKRGRRCEEDPWQANTLEWATSSPPPPHNFDAVPPVHSERPLWDLRLERAAAAGDEGAKELMAQGPRH